MAKQRYEHLKELRKSKPGLMQDRTFQSDYSHHRDMVEHPNMGSNLYIDKEQRDVLIAGAVTPIDALAQLFPRAYITNEGKDIDFTNAHQEERPWAARKSWEQLPHYQRRAIADFVGISGNARSGDIFDILQLTDKQRDKLFTLVDSDAAVSDKAWDEFHQVLDRQETARKDVYRG